jgi:RHS repeat-associated protein
VIFSALLGRGTIRFGRFARLLIIVSVFSALIFTKTQAFGQDLPDASQGLNPESTYHGSDIDFVDMVTGRLNLHIPLVVDRSQRGNLNFTYSLYFSGQTWFDNYVCNRAGCTSSWKLIKGTNEGLVFGIDGHINELNNKHCTVQTCGFSATAVNSSADDGSVHPLGTISGGAESLDGSGIREFVNSAGIAVLINGNGIQTSQPSYNATTGAYTKLIEDPNGNEITSSGNVTNTIPLVMTDTLGRTWTQTFGSTNVSGCPVAAVNTTLWDIPGPANINNGIREFKFCYSNVSIQTHFNQSPVIEYSGTWKLMTGVVLPDGTTWRFDYNSYGDPAKVYLPTGGTITYQYVTGDPCENNGNGLETVSQRTVYDGTNSNTWQYNHIANSFIGGMRVTDPFGNDTVYNPVAKTTPPYKVQGGFILSCAMGTGTIQYFNGLYNSGTLLKTVTKSYQAIPNPFSYDTQGPDADPIVITGITTTYANGQTNQTQQSYDSGFTFTDTNSSTCCNGGNWHGIYGLVATKTEYDYGNGAPGSILASTNTTYLALSNSSYLNANLLNLASSAITLTAPSGGSKCSETDYGYDVASQIIASGVTQQHVTAPSPGILGNLTSVTRQLSSTPCQSGGSWSPLPPTNNYVYDTGKLQKSVDPLTNPTTYSYSGTYYGAYPTTVTNALGQQTNYTYDYHTGLVTAIQNPNDLANGRAGTNYIYDDMLRPTKANYPDTGQTTIAYNYSGNVFVGDTVTKLATPDPSIVTTQVFDGLGRPKETQSAVPTSTCPSGTSYLDTTYDGDGRTFSVSNPYCTTGDTTYGLTKTYYDALNRVTSVVDQDGSTVTTTYAGNTNTSPPTYCTTVTDEAGKMRKSCADGLGRMTGVWEDPNVLNYPTSYTYDALDNLLSVTQSGSRQRTFTYDSLSRLTQSANPESGAACYGTVSNGVCQQNGYDANSNLIYRTDARGILTTYAYDALNRIATKSFSDGTGSVTFGYDNPNAWGRTLTNTTGRLVTIGTGDGQGEVFSYDPLGRTVRDEQCILWGLNGCGLITAVYDLAGDPIQLNYPSGRVVTTQYNSAMQPTQVTFASFNGTSEGYNYLSSASYAPTGAPTNLTLGSGATETECYNNRLQPGNIQIASGTFTWLNRTYNFYPTGSGGCSPGSGGNDGNVMSIADNLQANRTQTFGYDNLNRISTAQSAATSGADCWGQSFGYDAWANLLAENVTKCAGTQLSIGVNSQNRITNSGFSYDASGDLLADGTNAYAYDAEGRINSFNSGAAKYAYDGNGRRVAKNVSGQISDYFYWNSNVVAEYSSATGVWSDYVYAGSRRLARADDYEDRILTSGNYCSGCGWQWASYAFSGAAGLAGYVIQPHDLLLVRQWQSTGAHGGPDISFTDGTRLASSVYDQNGQLINDDGAQQTWDNRRFDISAYVGKTVAGVALVTEGYTQPGYWDIYYQDMVLVSADGTVHPIYTREQSVSLTAAYSSGMTGVAYQVNVCCGGAVYADTATFYYHGDHLGSQRLITNSIGYPIWSGTYLPFGQEWNPQPTVNHYKFTGKERDSESGLDNFGARYMSSQYDRFMSPDWSASPVAVPYAIYSDPQTLNLYSYLRNNPVFRPDIDGHNWLDINQLKQDISQFIADHPRTFEAIKGTGQIVLGVATVATGVAATVGSGGVGTALGVTAAVGGSGTAIAGFMHVLNAAFPNPNNNINAATQAVETVSNPAGLMTTILTGGNLNAGETAASIFNAATSLNELANIGDQSTLEKAVTFGDTVTTGADVEGLFDSTPPPPPDQTNSPTPETYRTDQYLYED